MIDLSLEWEAECTQQCTAFVIIASGSGNGNVHATDTIDLVKFDFREHDLLFDPHRVVATTIKRLGAEKPRKSRIRGMVIEIRRSRNSYMRSPRRVTLQPIGQPSRILKPAMDLRAMRDNRLLASDQLHVRATAPSSSFLSCEAAPTPILMSDFGDTGNLHDVIKTQLFFQLGFESRRCNVF
jgi:hypothetical protein